MTNGVVSPSLPPSLPPSADSHRRRPPSINYATGQQQGKRQKYAVASPLMSFPLPIQPSIFMDILGLFACLHTGGMGLFLQKCKVEQSVVSDAATLRMVGRRTSSRIR